MDILEVLDASTVGVGERSGVAEVAKVEKSRAWR